MLVITILISIILLFQLGVFVMLYFAIKMLNRIYESNFELATHYMASQREQERQRHQLAGQRFSA